MTICPDCGKEFKRLNLHHDPPKSKIFIEYDFDFETFSWFPERYFIDKDGKKKLVRLHQKNRKLCNTCHRKADKSWGISRKKFKRKPKKWGGMKYKQGII